MIFFKVELTVVWVGGEAELEITSVEGLVKKGHLGVVIHSF